MKTLEITTLKLCKICEDNGHLPVTVKDTTKYQVDFCQGSPGTIPLFTAAAELFVAHRTRFLRAARVAGQLTWEEGLLMKGNGLCHGISGNGYMLHNLYRACKKVPRDDPEYEILTMEADCWRRRALMFGIALFHEGI
jgi:hypothetical protein